MSHCCDGVVYALCVCLECRVDDDDFLQVFCVHCCECRDVFDPFCRVCDWGVV